MANLKGFHKATEARKKSPVVSRPDLVAARNAALVKAAPAKSAKSATYAEVFARNATDSRMKCFRPDGTCYAIFTALRWAELRKAGKLDATLKRERDSGVIVDAA